MIGGTLFWIWTKTRENKREASTKAATRSAIFEALVNGRMRLKCHDYAEHHRVTSQDYEKKKDRYAIV